LTDGGDAVIRIGTRGSLLATTQAGTIRDQLIERGHRANWSSSAPRRPLHQPIAEIGVGVFTAALREAIHENRVDMAVHSYKICRPRRTPGSSSPRYPAARTPATRWWPATAWCWELPAGSVISTSSVRRAAQLRALGLGLEIRP
jgi:hydroxymethylbilane synthase